MKPRANFECVTCGKAEGVPAMIPDLPIDIKCCPYCGKKRGFTRLFDSVNVMGGKSRKLHKALDQDMAPVYEKHAAVKDGAKRFTEGSAEAMEKAFAKATPDERAKAQPFVNRAMPAAAALGALPAQARLDSRECLYPMTQRKVEPIWQRGTAQKTR